MPATYGVIDLFAGPGGLGEGFAGLKEKSHRPFRIEKSVEEEISACRTLRLRAFLREYEQRHGAFPDEFIEFHAGEIKEPNWAGVESEAWKLACTEVRQLKLGTTGARREVEQAIKEIRSAYGDDTILIGGPPCQAYSLVGRARSRGMKEYIPEKDKRHFLFKEYVRVLDQLRPAIFVMENVRGMLSSMVKSRRVFEMLMGDLSSLGHAGKELFQLRALRIDGDMIRLEEVEDYSDFIVRAEQFGVPQKRHRVIIIGVRSDLARSAGTVSIPLASPSRVTVAEAIGNMTPLRSGLSPARLDSPKAWKSVVTKAARRLLSVAKKPDAAGLSTRLNEISGLLQHAVSLRESKALPSGYGASNAPLLQWLENRQLRALAQHDTRGHMESDLGRYLFVSTFGEMEKRSPKSIDFPTKLAPNHRNWKTGKFSDRFRVQLANEPATTITSHISKDGHYFIHHDPLQCRSLTVREAARLQTFPDDYLFLGNRTQQYVQVGNAVPPYLARQIAQLLYRLLKKSKKP